MPIPAFAPVWSPSLLDDDDAVGVVVDDAVGAVVDEVEDVVGFFLILNPGEYI